MAKAMPTSRTKSLAKKLGLLKKRKADDSASAGNARKRRKGQLLSYVIVIDFESTCWKEKRGAQEIIEFPAVLVDLCAGKVIGEFHQYVQPCENPVLSEFCKELTGISQAQVNGGIPLPTCLFLFSKWLRQIQEERGLHVMEPGHQYNSDLDLCALATWTDWDLGVCLHFECKRKQIRKPIYFDHWVDLRRLYQQFYERKPSGLGGSLEDLGIQFSGRQHCGLDDARNTATLCLRFVTDGCKLNITKSLRKEKQIHPKVIIQAPNVTTQPTNHETRELSKTKSSLTEDTGTSNSATVETARCSKSRATVVVVTKQTISDRKENNSTETVANPGASLVDMNQKCAVRNEKNIESKALCFVEEAKSTACVIESELEDHDWMTNDDKFLTEVINELEKVEKSNNKINEIAEKISSKYDKTQVSVQSDIHEPTVSINKEFRFHHQDKNSENAPKRLAVNVKSTTRTTPSRAQCIPLIAPVTLLPPSHHSLSSLHKDMPKQQDRTIHSPLSNTPTLCTRVAQISPVCSSLSNTPNHNTRIAQPSPMTMCYSDLLLSTSNHRTRIPQSFSPIPTSTGTNQTEQDTPLSSTKPQQDVFCTPSTSQWLKTKSLSSSNLSFTTQTILAPLNGGKLTPPLCGCGKRSRRKMVTSPGPNNGRHFYSCSRGSASGCEYFKWESTSTQS